MKLTWFGGSCFRVYAGGQIVVVDAEAAPTGVDPIELAGGADLVVAMGAGLPAEAGTWRPRAPQRLLDAEDGPRRAEVWELGPGSVVIDTDGDAPLLLLGEPLAAFGKWIDKAVVVCFGSAAATLAAGLIAHRSPRLIALAAPNEAIDAAFAELSDSLDGTGLIALEAGLAVEV
ncbi:hypothetical protein IC608_04250 [Devosia sp. PTR5]|uniref:Uncharacterized protein n=1 Tax=Devosia oryzisoli TaxID=2774138 RepID=A0A927IRR3_9HYPH|nr:hypothetical protein [Devosia oryzisoli]MBD8064684.1 hypothetical protein [Devosia oryzisoli]